MLKVRLSDKQFDSLERITRRRLIEQVMFIYTPKYMYCLGALGNSWTMARYSMDECIDFENYKWEPDYKPEILDKWL